MGMGMGMDMDMNMTIGKRISELRKGKGYSQEYIAEKLDISRQAVSKWEQDLTVPDTYNLIALSELLDVSVEYLATGKSPAPQNEPPVATAPPNTCPQGLGVQKILGLILIGIGLLSGILGLILGEILIVLAVYLLVVGILCLTIRKHIGLTVTWTLLILTFLIFSIFTSWNPFAFLLSFGNINLSFIFGGIFCLTIIIATIVTVIVMIKKIKSNKK